ncbi:PREDICTED: uncharacterized protein LOC104587113 isoform X2 [Nelumbo nucifera]|uniref:Uncharacterized protein LOC104587113 isoform X2 n=1 Tax=Nelumbo nucifera TaxID=4432 RepID=A0A1U7YRQ2_NELNU|nr:PREDICTED: uncharacterized protein LOC104587113 isoform X2 [Nelumbo nucifera]
MENFSFLRNRYWVLRHGKSIPNERGLIVCSMENGMLNEYQLASEGVNQAQIAGEAFKKELKENNIPLENVRICYSPFSRTTHTAKVVASILNLPFEGPRCKYAEIWALDEKDPFMRPDCGESVADVVYRLTTAIITMEAEFEGCAILVVSHGDPLQILQTVLHATNKNAGSTGTDLLSRIEAIKVPSILSQHRKYALLTGELRQII